MNSKKLKFAIFFLLLLIFVLKASFVLALEIQYPKLPFSGVDPPQVFMEKIEKKLIPEEERLPLYVKYFYSLFLMISGLIIFGTITYGGIQYLLSAGAPVKMLAAREWIIGGILGLIIILSSYIILTAINPELKILKLGLVPIPKPEECDCSKPSGDLSDYCKKYCSLFEEPADKDIVYVEIPIGRLIERVVKKSMETKEIAQKAYNEAKAISDLSATLNELIKQCNCGFSLPESMDFSACPGNPWEKVAVPPACDRVGSYENCGCNYDSPCPTACLGGPRKSSVPIITDFTIGFNVRGAVHYGYGDILPFADSSHVDADLSEIKNMGGTVVRVFAANNLISDEEAAQRLHNFLDKASAYNISVIVSLIDFYKSGFNPQGTEGYYTESYGGILYLNHAFFDGGYKNRYKSFVKTVVSYNAGHPNIFAWEPGNELKDEFFPGTFVNFMNDMSATIKSVDPTTPVATGMINAGHTALAPAQIYPYLSDVDIITVHAGYGDRSGVADVEWAVANGKMAIVEEVWISGLGDRTDLFKNEIDYWKTAGASAFMPWGFVAKGLSDNGDGDSDVGVDTWIHTDYDSLFNLFSVSSGAVASFGIETSPCDVCPNRNDIKNTQTNILSRSAILNNLKIRLQTAKNALANERLRLQIAETLIRESLTPALSLDQISVRKEKIKIKRLRQWENVNITDDPLSGTEFSKLPTGFEDPTTFYVLEKGNEELIKTLESAIFESGPPPKTEPPPPPPPPPGGKLLDIPPFYQKDPAWARDIIDACPGGTSCSYDPDPVYDEDSIRCSGCGITSIAMILSYFKYDVNPGTIARRVQDGKEYSCSSHESYPYGLASMATEDPFYLSSEPTTNVDDLQAHLRMGHPVMAACTNWGPGMNHITVIYGVEGGSVYYQDTVYGKKAYPIEQVKNNFGCFAYFIFSKP